MPILEWVLLALLLLALASFPVALFLHLRTAYREGGWAQVKTAFMVAVAAILIFAAERIRENKGIDFFRRAIDHWFR
jgi:heme/copper-type cytochrome/quinol oxidase subunit 4